MYRKIILEMLLSGSISTPTAILTVFTLSYLAMADDVTPDPAQLPTVSTAELHSTLATKYTSLPTIHPEDLDSSKDSSLATSPIARMIKEDVLVNKNQSLPAEGKGGRQQMKHQFSELVITVIIFGVMAGIIGIILFIAFCIGRLRKKNSPGVAPELYQVAPLSSIEIENPEK
ncbi:glycophorin-A isoform X1 [Talpa occidentalis]|uniref:glycophorin-A isoform X1 n=1 Tax=Talpa occidentalis TaxID=50954 RepID=UPI0018907B2D|nr:glycophorin-A isoform X1 [Talpa occidentalis]